MKRIPLTQGQFALVDDDDFQRLSQYRWFAFWFPRIGKFYAGRSSKGTTIYMHREIINAPKGMKVDHKFHDTLDNRKSKLRIVTHSQNMMNRSGPRSRTVSGVRGVSWNIAVKKWVSYIKINGKNKYLGAYDTISEASKAYAEANAKHYGKFGGKF